MAEVEYPEHMNLLENIYGDSKRFMQVICNFLSNSIKFTPKYGTVRVVLKVLESQVMNSRRIQHILVAEAPKIC